MTPAASSPGSTRNSNAFCTNVCHAVHPEEPVAHAASFHARVQVRRMPHGPSVDAAADGAQADARERALGNDRRLRAADDVRQTCVRRASRARRATGRRRATDDTVRTRCATTPTRRARETRTTLHDAHRLRTKCARSGVEGHPLAHRAGRRVRRGRSAASRRSRWSQVRGADGKMSRPTSIRPPAYAGRRSTRAEKRRMDCIDCHNAAGHPFPIRRTWSTRRSTKARSTAACRRSRRARRRSSRRPPRSTGSRSERAREVRQADRRDGAQGCQKPELTKAEKSSSRTR